MDEALATTQPLVMHLLELRRRILRLVAAFLVAAGLAYVYRQPIIGIIMRPLHQPVFYTNPQGGFEFLLRVSSLIGLIAVVPLIVYHLIKFVEPAFDFKFSRSYVGFLFFFSLFLAACGVVFGYVVILPLTLHFFAGFGSNLVKPLITAGDYLSMVIGLLVTFAIFFQLPIVLLIINRMTPLSPSKLMKYQRHVIIGSLAIAVILPFTYDPITQFVMAVPLIGLYELSIVMLRLVNRRQRQASRRLEARLAAAPETAPAQELHARAILDTLRPQRSGGAAPRVLDLRSVKLSDS